MRVVVWITDENGRTADLEFPESTGGVLEVSEIILTLRTVYHGDRIPRLTLEEHDRVTGFEFPDIPVPIWQRREP
ncbi:MAG: hypothetical protein LUQ37_10040 [Methanoregulaceae archaeon]|jgi:hypothetical protein|nr:hypothetical protein [Methanoregulaceae archaeon]